MSWKSTAAVITGLVLLAATASAQTPAPEVGPVPDFQVRMQIATAAPASGRLILVAIRPEERMTFAPPGQTATPEQIQTRIIQQLPSLTEYLNVTGIGPSVSPTSSTVTRSVAGVKISEGQSLTIGGGAQTYPAGPHFKPGVYFVQAILDTDGNYAYDQKPSHGDIVSPVTAYTYPGPPPVLTLNKVVPPAVHIWDQPAPAANASPALLIQYSHRQDAASHSDRVNVPSPALTSFHHKPTAIRAYVVRPPGYETGSDHYPTVFRFEGFGGSYNTLAATIEQMYADMASGAAPPMIWVFLDHAGPTGTHEFADSANNGPWGKALTEEFIPWLDSHYSTDGASGRFTGGHSSGGWAALWLQVRYPKLFAGAWPTAPDPVDFHSFTNIDIYAPGANAFREPDGTPTPLMRIANSDNTIPFKAYSDLESVTGEVGGQLASFDWVFSPRGANGRPKPLFDRGTGAVDPTVAAYWRDNYDITFIIRRDWARLKPDLNGKIHLWVGTRDTYHLDRPARLLKATLDALGARSEFHFVEGASHSTLMTGTLPNGGVDFGALERQLAWEMYAQARPNSALRPPAPVRKAA